MHQQVWTLRIYGKVVIDATGDGDVVYKFGALVREHPGLPCARGGGKNLRFLPEGLSGKCQSPSQLRCQPPAGGPVAALTVHRTVIHSRDCASLTLYTRGPLESLSSNWPVC